MPLPKQQLAQLQVDLQVHQQRVASLKTTQAEINNELAVHDVILRLGQDPNILALLNEMYDHPEIADQMKNDPQAYLQSRGIILPPGGIVSASRPTPQSAVVVASYHIGRFQFDAKWDTMNGFTVHQPVQQ